MSIKKVKTITHKHQDHSPKNDQFVTSKTYLVLCLLIYLVSVFVIDHFGDSLAFYIRDALENFTNRGKGFHIVKRFVLWDVIIDLGFFTIIGAAFTKYPKAFFVFNGFKKDAENSSGSSLLRVIRNCILTSFVLILLFGIIQGFLFWFPRQVVAMYLELYYPEMGLQGDSQSQYDYFGHGLKLINFSLIFIFLFRSSIITQILERIFTHRRRLRPLHFLLLISALILLILLAGRFSPQRQYIKIQDRVDEIKQEEPPKYSYWNRPLNGPKYPWKDKAKVEEPIKAAPASDTEKPRAHITVHDSSTGETTTND